MIKLSHPQVLTIAPAQHREPTHHLRHERASGTGARSRDTDPAVKPLATRPSPLRTAQPAPRPVLTSGVTLVLIGPPGAGKSTVGPLVASALDVEFVDADEASIPYYEEAGWPLTRFGDLIEVAGYERAHLAWEEALAYAAPRLLRDHRDAVIAFGAGHTHVTTPARRAIIRRTLQEHTVVLLRPAQDPAVSVAELRSRCVAGKGLDWIRDGVDWLDRWSRDGLDDHLATQTVYTIGRSPTQVASDVELAMTIASTRPM